nr:ribonuclease H-like domain-containing protein [Tanacetum cinerariifolium]
GLQTSQERARNSRNRSRDARNAGYRGRDNGKSPTKEKDEKALVVHDGFGTYEWSYQLAEEATDFAFMAFTSNPSSSSSSNSEREKLSKANLEIIDYQYGLELIEGQLRVHQQNKVIYEKKIRVLEYEVKDKSNLLKYTQKELNKALREKEDLKAKLKKFETSSKKFTKVRDSQISAKLKTGLGFDSWFNEKEALDVKEEEVTETVFDNHSSDEKNSLANDRFKKSEGYHVVHPPLTGNYMPPKSDLSFAQLDNSIYKFKISETVTSLTKDEKDALETNTACAEKPKEDWSSASLIQDWDTDSENDSVFRPEHIPAKIDFMKAGESVKHVKPVKHFKPVKTIKQTKKSKNFTSSLKVDRKDWNGKMTKKLRLGFGFTKKGNPQQALKNKEIVDSGCFRHMIENKAYLANYQEIKDGGFVSFGSSIGKFKGKVDEGFLVGYSGTSQAFRVFNTKTKKVKGNLHVRFLEKKPNVVGTWPN